MAQSPAPRLPGRHLVQVPGPTNVPERVLRAMAAPTLDHRGPEFATLFQEFMPLLQRVFSTSGPVVIFPGSGTGGWEAALVNTLSPGDAVLTVETGHFASLWAKVAAQFGLDVQTIATDWRSPVNPALVRERLSADAAHAIKAVLVTHNETSTGVTSDIAAVREAIDAAGHPALLFVDAVSSLASIDYRHDEWRVDVTVAGSQKGLMLPPGLGFNAVSEKALAASTGASLPRAFWEWKPVLDQNASGFFPYTPATNLLLGLREALGMLMEEGLEQIFSRHLRHSRAARAAVEAWGLELLCTAKEAYSPTVTAVLLPEGHTDAEFRKVAHDHFGLALGAGMGQLAGKVFRIGHLGDFDDLSLIAALAGVELSLERGGLPHHHGGVAAALDELRASA
ncbi:MAG TPA: aminotransferase class V-fold PLP-dependent enzyme [Acidimicrobiales bacterium]|nr:aminotransferase class V-fold PLP-dependent enzyme [Acidimicrobiales bacterium]